MGPFRYVTLFESPFMDSGLSERENNALRASSLLAVPPPPPLPEANLTHWASYVQDVASGMQKPPCVATDRPSQDMAGVLHKLENLTGVGFWCLCYTIGSSCRCSRAAPQAPPSYRDQALWALPLPSYVSMASPLITTASTSMRGVSLTSGPPPGFPAREAPTPMDVSPASQSYNLLAQVEVRRGLQPQSAPGSARPRAPGATSLHQEHPPATHQLAATSGSHEVTSATPYQQAVHLPQQVRYASPVTKTETTMSQSQSVATRGRPHSRECGSHQASTSHSRAGRDRSSTRGPRKRRGITSENPMDDLMNFIPSGWRRDLIRMVGCFYASLMTPLNSQEWDNDQDKFIRAMDQCKDSKWLDIKELAPLRYMPYVARCLEETTSHHLKGLGLHTKWLKARSYYHWKVAELNQLQHCPHLRGLPLPL